MLSVVIISLKIQTGHSVIDICARRLSLWQEVKELANLQKELIVKLWKEGKSYRKISDNLNIPFTTIS